MMEEILPTESEEDFYSEEFLGACAEDDEINSCEEGFMRGYLL